ncbi:MAG: hypothetical protein AAB682_00190 [Patescibacteria group bacterium]
MCRDRSVPRITVALACDDTGYVGRYQNNYQRPGPSDEELLICYSGALRAYRLLEGKGIEVAEIGLSFSRRNVEWKVQPHFYVNFSIGGHCIQVRSDPDDQFLFSEMQAKILASVRDAMEDTQKAVKHLEKIIGERLP